MAYFVEYVTELLNKIMPYSTKLSNQSTAQCIFSLINPLLEIVPKKNNEKSSCRVLIEKYAMICQADFEKFPFYDIITF